MITPAQRAEILRHFGERWKVGTIAQLGLHRDCRGQGSAAACCVAPSSYLIRDLTQYPAHGSTRQRGYTGSVIQVRRLVRRLRPTSHPGR